MGELDKLVPSVNPDEFVAWLVGIILDLAQILQRVAVPLALIAVILGALLLLFGTVSGSRDLRRTGVIAIVGSFVWLLLIKGAPALVGMFAGLADTAPR